MDTPHVSKLWSDLMHRTESLSSIPNKLTVLPKLGLLSSCEGEVEELMKQIDIMLKGKKAYWNHETGLLRTKIEQLEQEKLIQRATLERKYHEIGQLRNSLDGMERSQKESVLVYERQVSTLKDQVHGMKSEYDRLQKRYHKPPSTDNSSRHGPVPSIDSSSAWQGHAANIPERRSYHRSVFEKGRDETDTLDMRSLMNKIELCRQQEKNWEQERKDLNVLTECLRSQNKALIEKSDSTSEQLNRCEHQLRTCQAQLQSCEAKLSSSEAQLEEHRTLGSNEVALKSRLAEVESRLQSSQDIVSNQETQLGRLKGLLNDSMQSQKRSKYKQDENELNLKKSNQAVKKLEEERSLLLDKVSHLEQLLLTAQDDQRHLTEQIAKLKHQLYERDRLINSLEGVKQDDQQLVNLRRQLNEAIEQLISSKNVEQTLREEVRTLREHVCQPVEQQRRSSQTKQSSQDSSHNQNNGTVDNQNGDSRVTSDENNQQRCLEDMQRKIFALEDELEIKNRYLEELERNRGVLANYLTDVNHIIQNPPSQPNRNYNASPSSTGRDSSVGRGGYSHAATAACSNNLSSQSSVPETPESPSIYDTVDLATEEFRREQDAQSHLLESILDFNIDRLRADTDATLLKYANNLTNS